LCIYLLGWGGWFGGVGCYVDGVGVGGGFGVLYDVVWGVFIWIDWGDLVGLFVCGFGFVFVGFLGLYVILFMRCLCGYCLGVIGL